MNGVAKAFEKEATIMEHKLEGIYNKLKVERIATNIEHLSDSHGEEHPDINIENVGINIIRRAYAKLNIDITPRGVYWLFWWTFTHHDDNNHRMLPGPD